MKVILNKCGGGFGLSELAVSRFVELEGIEYRKVYIDEVLFYYEFLIDNEWKYFGVFQDDNEFRTNKNLIKAVEELGELSFGEYAKLKIVEIPDDVKFFIDNRDGIEIIREEHRIWS